MLSCYIPGCLLFMMDSPVLKGKKVLYAALGCKLNFAEMSSLGRALSEAGFEKLKPGEKPDICLIHTCSVTEMADKKSRQLIHRLIRRYPEAIVIVTGCYAQLQPEAVAAIPGVDLVLGANEKGHLLAFLEKLTTQPTQTVAVSSRKQIDGFQPAVSREDRTRYFLKVQDGCDYFCTYCTIPFARGKSRNGSISLLIEQARQVAREGGKEIVLTGVNIGDFGKTTGESLLDLLQALDEVDGIERFRLSSIEPDLLTDDIIQFMATSRRFMPHFHLPLQAGSDELLRLMHRRYDTALFADRVERIRSRMPEAFIGVDVIVGCRGETESLFEASYSFVEQLKVAQLHVFPCKPCLIKNGRLFIVPLREETAWV